MRPAGVTHRQATRTPRRGETTVEFAISIVVILAFLFGIIDWGIAFHMHQRIVYNASEAARWVSVRGSSQEFRDQGRAIVRCGKPVCGPDDFIPAGLDDDKVTVEAPTVNDIVSGATTNPRRHIVVTVDGYQYRMFTPFVGRVLSPRKIVISHPSECWESACADTP